MDIPNEILGTIHTVIEQVDIPIEILGVKTEAEPLKWVLNSRGKQWVLNPQTAQWELNTQVTDWSLNARLVQWDLQKPKTMKWTVK